jgi:hypothetical protein
LKKMDGRELNGQRITLRLVSKEWDAKEGWEKM